MFHRFTSWPKLIAAIVGGVGVSGVFSAWSLRFESPMPSITWDWRPMIASVALLVLSYLLATGREWARRTLVWTVSLIGMSIVLWRGILLFPKSYTDLSPEQIGVIRLGTFLGDLSWFFLILTLLIFFVLLLCHADVVASFRDRSGHPKGLTKCQPRIEAIAKIAGKMT
jgi:hypothetical protein